MSKEIVSRSKLIILNATDGEQLNGDFNSDILFNFTDVIKRHYNTLYLTVSVQSAEIPYSFYNVSELTNIIYYTIQDTGGLGSLYSNYTMNIAEGNYNATTFITEFNANFLTGGHGKTATLSISSLTGKFNLKPSDDTFEILIYNTTTTAQRIIGMKNQDTTFSYNSNEGTSFIFPANLLGTQKIKIFSKALSCDNLTSHHLASNDMIDAVSVNASPFELISYSNTNAKESHMKSTEVSQIDITLKDEYNNEIDFNGIDWSISLVITEYLYGENIIPLGSLDDIYSHKRNIVLDDIKKSKKIKIEKKDKDENAFIDKELQFLAE